MSLFDFADLGIDISARGSESLHGLRISAAVSVTDSSLRLIQTLAMLGADVRCCSNNILYTDDHSAADIARYSTAFFASDGGSVNSYWANTLNALDWGPDGGPDVIIDDEGNLSCVIEVGVMAEEEFEKTGKLTGMISMGNPELELMYGLMQHSIMVDPTKYRKMKERLNSTSKRISNAVMMLNRFHGHGRRPIISVDDFVCKSKEPLEEHVNRGNCFACGDPNHWKKECPWVNLPCQEANCMGQMLLHSSNQAKSFGKKFLKCNTAGCSGFKWLGNAIPTASKYEEIAESSKAKQGKERLDFDTGTKDNKVRITFEGTIDDMCMFISKLGLLNKLSAADLN